MYLFGGQESPIFNLYPTYREGTTPSFQPSSVSLLFGVRNYDNYLYDLLAEKGWIEGNSPILIRRRTPQQYVVPSPVQEINYEEKEKSSILSQLQKDLDYYESKNTNSPTKSSFTKSDKIVINQDKLNPPVSSKDILSSRLSLYGLKEKTKINGDGNCQFASISDQIYSDQKYHKLVRSKVVDWLRSNQKFKLPNGTILEEYIDKDYFPTWDDYCDYMSEPGIWGDHLTLIAASVCFKLRIVIISSVDASRGGDPVTIISAIPDSELKTIFLSHLHELHYSSLEKA